MPPTGYFKEKANAKLNLNFKVIRKLKSNYHEIDSIVTFLPDLYDTLYIKKSNKNKIIITGPQSESLIKNGGDTIVIKSIENLSKLLNIKIHLDILLKKNIPINSGLGGGSADAAAIIRAILKLYKPIQEKKIINVLHEIGSDVPVCFFSKNSHVTGIGEVIRPLKNYKKKFWVLLVKPNTNYTTASIFKKFEGPFLKREKFKYTINNIIDDLNVHENSLESTVCKIEDKVKNFITNLPCFNNITKPRITGTGSVIFLLFKSEEELKKYKRKISDLIKNTWYTTSSIIL